MSRVAVPREEMTFSFCCMAELPGLCMLNLEGFFLALLSEPFSLLFVLLWLCHSRKELGEQCGGEISLPSEPALAWGPSGVPWLPAARLPGCSSCPGGAVATPLRVLS